MDKSLFFLTLCLCCIWLMVDSAVGNDRLGSFLGTVFPFMGGGGSVSTPASNEEVAPSTAFSDKMNVPEKYEPSNSFTPVSPSGVVGWNSNRV